MRWNAGLFGFRYYLSMGKQEEALALAESLLTEIELCKLRPTEVVLKASRLARLVGNDELSEFTRLERVGYRGTNWSRYAQLAGRGAEEDKFYTDSISKIEGAIASSEAAVAALTGDRQFAGDHIVVASRDHDQAISLHAAQIGKWRGISGQIVSTIYDLVTEIYHELQFSELQATLFAEVQQRVDGSLSEAGGAALSKIESISARLRDSDVESISQALTTCRRLIDSTADFLLPPSAEKYQLDENTSLALGTSNVLNRLQAYVHKVGVSKSRRDRLRRSMKDLYDRCSAGTHDSVSADEARFIFLATYVALGEILTLENGETAHA